MNAWKTRLLCAIAFLLLICTQSYGTENLTVDLREEQWNWTPGGVASFSGVISGDTSLLAGGVLTLEAMNEASGEAVGRIVFTSVGDKKIKARKQTGEFHLPEEQTGQEIAFTGVWYIPDNFTQQRIAVSLLLEDAEGIVQGKGSITPGSDNAPQTGGRTLIRIPFDTDQVILILGIICGAVWLCVALRWIILKKQMRA